MKRIACVVLGLVLAFGALASATETRVVTLGENNIILEDDRNIFLFPSTVVRNPRLVIGEFGRMYEDPYDLSLGEFEDLGIHWQLGGDDPPVLATYLHNRALVAPDHFPLGYIDYDDMPYGNQRIDLFGGSKLNDMPVGVHVGLVHSSASVDDTAGVIDYYQYPSFDEKSLAMYTLDLGLSSPDERVDVAAGVTLISFVDRNSYWDTKRIIYDRLKSEGSYELGGRVRYFAEQNSEYALVPHASVSTSKLEYGWYYWDSGDNRVKLSETIKYSTLELDLGSGVHWTPSKRAFVIMDFGVSVWRETYERTDPEDEENPLQREDKKRTTTIPYFKAGFEGKVLDWLIARFGATSYWNRYKREVTADPGSGEFNVNWPENSTYLGLAFQWNRLRIDTYTDPELFLDGFHFISGQSNEMNWMLSALYEL